MKLLEVKQGDKAAIKRFLELPVKIYKDDPKWIRPLDKDIETIFDPNRNKFWRHGKAIRWVLVNDKGEDIGRVAAFINERTANTEDQPTGGMGFFDCINDQTAANVLLEKCKEWLTANGMEAMDGPINFGERQQWWGLLVEGFHEPVYQMNYNPPYYQELFENYGFQLYFKQFVLFRNVQDPVQEKFNVKYDKLMETPGYTFRHIRKKEINKFAEDFLYIYNTAWGGHANFKTMRKEQAYKLMKNLKPIIAEELAWFAYHNDQPVGFFIMIPDLNDVIRDFKGKFGLWQKLKVLYRIRLRRVNKCYGILFGVVPDHQGLGVDAGIIKTAGNFLHRLKRWGHMEMVWIGDFNPKMLKVAMDVGGEIYKTYITMRYLFDRTKLFERLPLMTETKEAVDNKKKKDEEEPES